MTNVCGAPVVVAVDGSASALDAVRVASREATARNRPLRVVHALSWPLIGAALGALAGSPPEAGPRNHAQEIVAEAVAEAKKVSAEVDVVGEIVDGSPTPVLLRESRDAALLVLGSRGLGGFAELLVGSSAVQVSARADCPVLVVRGEARADGPVVVGVDGLALSTEAIGFAFEEAALRNTDLVAVHSWLYPTPVGSGEVLPRRTTSTRWSRRRSGRSPRQSPAGRSGTRRCGCGGAWSRARRPGCWSRSPRPPS